MNEENKKNKSIYYIILFAIGFICIYIIIGIIFVDQDELIKMSDSLQETAGRFRGITYTYETAIMIFLIIPIIILVIHCIKKIREKD